MQKTIAIKTKMLMGQGLLEKEPFNYEFTHDSIGRIKEASNVFAEQHSKTVILKPNLVPFDMDGAYDAVRKVYAGSWYQMKGGEWESREIFGSPRTALEYQRGVEGLVEGKRLPIYWQIDSNPIFAENQGFVVWINKYLLPYGWNNCVVFYLHNEDESRGVRVTIGNLEDVTKFLSKDIRLNIQKERYEMMIEHWETAEEEKIYPYKNIGADRQTEFFHLPRNFKLYDWSGNANLLVVLLVDKYIVIGTEGMENAVAMKCEDYGIGSDKHDNRYPILTGKDSILSVWGYGAAMLGFKPLHYEKQGSLKTNRIWLQEEPNEPEIVCQRAIVPEGASITMVGKYGKEDGLDGIFGTYTLKGTPIVDGDNPVLSAAHLDYLKEKEKNWKGKNPETLTVAEKAAIKKKIELERKMLEYNKTVTNYTPIIYRFGMRQPPKRQEVEIKELPLPNTVINYDESLSGDVAGEFWGGTQTTVLSCYKERIADVHKLKGQEIDVEIKPYNKDYYLRRGRFSIQNPKISTEKKNIVRVTLTGEDTLTKLGGIKFKNSISLDDRNYTDIEMMQYLFESLMGKTLIATGDAIPLPISENTKEPNWKTVSGSSILDFAMGVREHSCKLLYPDRDGNIIYRPRPTKDSLALFELDASIDIIGIPEYQFPEELLKTRFSIIGKAGQDIKGVYNAGETLVGVAYNKELERAIGRSVIALPIQNATFSDWPSIRRRMLFDYSIYTAQNSILNFELRNYEDYFDMYLFDVFSWNDPEFPEYSGKYMLTKTDLSIRDRLLNYIKIEGVSLWQGN